MKKMTEDQKREGLANYLENLAAQLRQPRWEEIEFEINEDKPAVMGTDITISLTLRKPTDG